MTEAVLFFLCVVGIMTSLSCVAIVVGVMVRRQREREFKNFLNKK